MADFTCRVLLQVRLWGRESETLVRPLPIVMRNEVPRHAFEVATAGDQHVIEALGPDCPYPALCEGSP